MAKTTIQGLIGKVRAKAKRYQFDNSGSKSRLIRVALLLQNQTKINVRRQGVVDSGNLLNSIQGKVSSDKNRAVVTYGSFNVRYAALNEFGGPFTDKMRRAMFARFRAEGKPKRPGKNVIQGSFFKAMPYIRPALIQQRRKILEILQSG